MQFFNAISKPTGWSLFIFKANHSNITEIQAYAPTGNVDEAEVQQFNEDLQNLLEVALKKDVLFIRGDWNAKVGSQDIPQVTRKFGLGVQNETGQRLPEFCQENALVIANTLFQHYNSKHGHHQMVNIEIKLIIFFAAKDGKAPYSQQKKKKKWQGADHGLDRELLIAKLRLKLKKVEKTTRPFTYDLN